MREVWKYEISIQDNFTINLPKDAQILCFQVQYGIPRIWALVNPKNDLEERKFRLIGTGHEIKVGIVERFGFDIKEGLHYIGTIQMLEGKLVYHLFEVD